VIAHPVRPLGGLVEFLDSQRRPITSHERISGVVPYYGANGVQGYVDGWLFDEPLVLLAEDGGHFDDPRRGIAYGVVGKSWVNNHAHVLRPKPAADFRYLVRVLEHYDARPFLTGTTRAKLTKSAAQRMPIPVPPIDEQKRIAAVLDQADDLRTKRRASLDLVDSLRDSVFLDMFGDPAVNSKGWEITPFGVQVDSVRYGTGSPPAYVESGVPFLRATNVKSGGISGHDLKHISPGDAVTLARCAVRAGDLLIVRSGVNTGECAVVPIEYDGACAAFDMIVRLPYASAVFFNQLINSPFGKRSLEPLTRRAAQPHLNAEQLRSLAFMSPPNYLREEFAARVSQLAHHRSGISHGLVALDRLFLSLQHRAFSGAV